MAIVRLSQYLDRPISYRSIHEACIDYANTSFITATGGTLSTYEDYIIHTFTTGGTFTVINGGNIDVLVVAGGGAGGATMGGGGGAGGVIYQSNFSISPGSYSVTVGAGGAAQAGTGNNGGNSIFDTLVAIGGGGGGGGNNVNGVSGGSGGGTGFQNGTAVAGLGTPGQGRDGGVGAGIYNNGGCGGAGGGAGTVGGNATRAVSGGTGGTGLASSISGSELYYGGGGGGGGNNYTGGNGGAGGLGGGGAGGRNTAGVAGTANTGGGGGGGGYNGATFDRWGGNGGSGIVIIRYKRDTSIPIPLTISGIQYWFDANNGPLTSGGITPTNGEFVATWTDKSGNNRNAITGLAPTYITNALNGNPVVRFSSSQYLTHSGYSPGNVAMTYVLVERNLTGGLGAAPISWGSTSRDSGIILQNNNGMQPFSNTQAFTNTTGRCWIYRQNNTGSGDNGMVNGVLITPTSNSAGNIAGPFDIGRRNVSSIYCGGDIAEIIVYNRAITDNERSLLASYLHNKYAL